MIIKKLKLHRFGKFNNFELELIEGLNIIYGENESGKSTIQAFIKGMLYGMNSQKQSIRENDRKRFLPWDKDTASGQLYFQDAKKKNYIINRIFGLAKRFDECQVLNKITGNKADNFNGESPGEVVLGIGEETFEKTAFMRQLSSEVSRDKNDEIMARLANLQQSGDEDISYHKACKRLNQAKKFLRGIRKNGKLDELEEKIILLTEEKEDSIVLHSQHTNYRMRLNELYKDKVALKENIETLEMYKKQAKNIKLCYEYKRISGYIEKLNILSSQANNVKSSKIDTLNLRKDILVDKKRNSSIAVLIFVIMFVIGLYLGYNNKYFWYMISFVSICINIYFIKLRKNIHIDIINIGKAIDSEKENYRINDEIHNDNKNITIFEAQKHKEKLTKQFNESGIYDIKGEIDKVLTNDIYMEDEEDIENQIKGDYQQLFSIEKDIIDIENLLKNSFSGKRTVLEIEEEIRVEKEKIQDYQDVLESIEVANEVLKDSFEELQKGFGSKLNKIAGNIISSITCNKYNEIKVSENYGIKITAEKGTQIKEIDYFSNGTWDQIYFALRIGIIKLIFENAENHPPLILDEAFIQYDKLRLYAALDYLYEYSKTNQVILFTCYKREVEYLEKFQDVNIIKL